MKADVLNVPEASREVSPVWIPDSRRLQLPTREGLEGQEIVTSGRAFGIEGGHCPLIQNHYEICPRYMSMIQERTEEQAVRDVWSEDSEICYRFSPAIGRNKYQDANNLMLYIESTAK